jgi:hypothetical protein
MRTGLRTSHRRRRPEPVRKRTSEGARVRAEKRHAEDATDAQVDPRRLGRRK